VGVVSLTSIRFFMSNVLEVFMVIFD
jgi:hypothetical protein